MGRFIAAKVTQCHGISYFSSAFGKGHRNILAVIVVKVVQRGVNIAVEPLKADSEIALLGKAWLKSYILY